MFAKFYQLNAIANSDAEFGRRVLMLASSSTPAPHLGGGDASETPFLPVEEWNSYQS